jgi:hypothetical protein
MRKRIHKFLFYTLLLSVYGVFFSVESFYNFEGHSNARDIISYSSIIKHSSDSRSGVRTSPLPYPSSHNTRLNKRYHQEDFPPCAVYRVTSPVRYIIPKTLRLYPALRLPVVTIFHPQLRGPPFSV